MNNAAIIEKLNGLAKPVGSMGRLEALATELALTQNSLSPSSRPAHLALFAGDHGVIEEGVTAWPASVTTAMVETILKGRAVSSALAKAHDVRVSVVDMGIATPISLPSPSHFYDRRQGEGTANLAAGPAMTAAQFDAAWNAGAEQAHIAVGAGAKLLIAGEMGIGNTTPAACITRLVTGSADCIGAGAGADDAMIARKRAVVDRAAARYPASSRDAFAALSGFELAAMAGFFAEGARLGATLLLDGFIATSAALMAETLLPGAKQSMIAAHLSAEPGHRAALDWLGKSAILDWGMRLGEGSGALVALPLLDAAAALLNDVAPLSEVIGS